MKNKDVAYAKIVKTYSGYRVNITLPSRYGSPLYGPDCPTKEEAAEIFINACRENKWIAVISN